MLADIKKELISHPNKLKELLEYYGFANVVNHGKYISFGRDDSEESSKKSLNIWLNDEWINIKDWSKNKRLDLFAYLEDEKGIAFKETIKYIKTILNISNTYYDSKEDSVHIFGGFYDKIYRKKRDVELRTYDEIILNKYENVPNKRFTKDNITVKTQMKYNIGYDIESQAITIPLRNQVGELVGVKVRKNCDADETDMKYYYEIPCSISNILYGYSENYNNILNDKKVYIFEAEKSVLQCDSYGIFYALSIGSSSISTQQIKMILELDPKEVIFLHDEGLEMEQISRNIKLFMIYSKLKDINIGYWDSTLDNSIPKKSSLSDLGETRFIYGIENEIIYV